jgi:predicted nucleic acid-binding protein
LGRGTPQDYRVRQWLASGTELRISAIAWAEFLCGPVSSEQVHDAAEIVGPPLDFIANDATLAAQLFNVTGRRRGSLSNCMIAAACIRAGTSLATENLDDFRRFEPHGLKLG